MRISKISLVSGVMHHMDIPLDPQKFSECNDASWRTRPLIQNAFPELTVDQREFLLTGITPDEWGDKMAREEEEMEVKSFNIEYQSSKHVVANCTLQGKGEYPIHRMFDAIDQFCRERFDHSKHNDFKEVRDQILDVTLLD